MQYEKALQTIFNDVSTPDHVIGNITRTYHPYTVNAFDHSDEIRIIIEKGELITATYNSKIYIEGTITAEDPAKQYNLNNPLFLFDEIRFQLSDIVIDSCKSPGLVSSIYGKCAYTLGEKTALSSAGWNDANNESQLLDTTKKSFCTLIPLNHILGFCSTYCRNIINSRQELIMIRSKSDVDCFNGETSIKIKIEKIHWLVDHISPSDEARLKIYNHINNHDLIKIGFHARGLFQYPALPTSTNLLTWSIQNTIGSRRPRWFIIAFQTDKKNNKTADASELSNADISDVTVYINNSRFPYEKRNNDFSKNRYTLAYSDYLNFQCKYFGKQIGEPILDYSTFKTSPIFIVDASKQNEYADEPVLSIKLEIEGSLNAFPSKTIANLIVLYDVFLSYSPFSGIVNLL